MSRIPSVLRSLLCLVVCTFALSTGVTQGQPPLPPGPPAIASAPPIETLIAQLAQPGPARLATLDALMDRGPAAAVATTALTVLLQDPDPVTRGHAARTLGAIGSAAAPAVEGLTAALGDTSASVRAYAAYALGMIGPAAKPAFDKITACVTDDDPTVRREAVKAIRKLHIDLNLLIPTLVKVLEKSSSVEVMMAMQAIAEGGATAVPALVEALKHPEARHYACQILSQIGADAAAAAPAVAEMLNDKQAENRREAVLCLGHIGAAAQSSAPAILALTADADSGTRAAALWSAIMVGAPAADVLAKARPMIGDPDALVQLVSLWAVAKLDTSDAQGRAKAVEVFVAALKDKSPALRGAAARALIDLKVDDPAAKEAMLHSIGDGDEVVRSIVTEAVMAKGAEAVPRLIAALDKPELRGFAASLLAQLGPQGKGAKDALQKFAADADPQIRAVVTAALAMTSGDDPAVLAQTIAALEDVNADVRCAAADGLAANGPAAKSALNALQKHAQDPDPVVRDAVLHAIDAISK